MVKRYLSMFIVLAFLFSGISAMAGGAPQEGSIVTPENGDTAEIDLTGSTSGYFTENKGQWDDAFSFIGDSSFGEIGLGRSTAYYNLFNAPIEDVNRLGEKVMAHDGGYVISFTFEGAREVEPVGSEELSHDNNYFLGNDESKWVVDVDNFEGAVYEGLWDGIDLSYFFTDSGAKYEFVLEPFADPGDIIIRVDGHRSIGIEGNDLVIDVDGEKKVRDSGLHIYYNDGTEEELAGSFKVIDGSSYTFELPDYDPSRGVVIDPYLWSTYHGGYSYDYGYAVDLDSSGDPIITGSTQSSNFPILGAWDSSVSGYDVFVSKYTSGGSLSFSTFIGGSYSDYAYDIAVDSSGNAYITGETYGYSYNNYPTTYGALYTTGRGYSYDAFVTKLGSSGNSLIYSTYLGGTYYDWGFGIDVDSDGYAYICGMTSSYNFPTVNAYRSSISYSSSSYVDVFVSKLNSAGSGLMYSTFIGGYIYSSYSGSYPDVASDIVCDSDGNAYITGYVYGYSSSSNYWPRTTGAYDTTPNGGYSDAYLTILDTESSGTSSLTYSSFLGGSSYDRGYGIELDQDGNVYVAGVTSSYNFPTTSGAFQTSNGGSYDFFVTKFNASGTVPFSTLDYSTYIGGSSNEYMNQGSRYPARGGPLAVDSHGHAYITGHTYSSNYDTKYATQSSKGSGYDAVYTKLSQDGSALMESTYLGGSSDDYGYGIAVDSSTNAYITGSTYSYNFPTYNARDSSSNGYYDVFLTKYYRDIPDFTPPTFVADGSDTIATTGDPFSANISLTDNVKVYAAYVEYWFEKDSTFSSHYNISLAEVAPGVFEKDINVWYSNADYLHYKLSGRDVKENYYSHSEVNITIFDNDGPELVAIHTEQPTTGDPTRMNITVWDNWDGYEVVNAYVHYTWDGWATSFNETLSYNETYMVYRGGIVDIPHTLGPLEFTISAVDAQSQWGTYELETDIIDNDLPEYNGDLSLNPTTGDLFNITIDVFDNIEVGEVYLHADYLDGYSLPSYPMMYDPATLNWYWNLPYRHTMSGITYNFTVIDTSGNFIWTPNSTMMPSDNDIPEIFADMSPLYGNAGTDYRFRVLCTDNIELDNIEVVYSTSIDPGEVHADMTELSDGQFYHDIVLPSQPCSLYYRFIAEDWQGLTAETLQKTVEVKDIEIPSIDDLEFEVLAYTGDDYVITATVRDDTLLSYARVYYYFGDQEPVDPMVAAADNVGADYTFTIKVPDSLSDLNFKVVASDAESNIQAVGWITITVMDNDLPELVEDLSHAMGENAGPTTGDGYMFMANVSDNVGIGSVMAYYTMPGAEEMNIPLEMTTRGICCYQGMVTVPNDMTGEMSYFFVITDTSENQYVTENMTEEVVDDEPPVPMINLPEVLYQGQEFTLDATPSSDNVGIVEWTWTFLEKDGTPVVLYGETVNYTFMGAGLYEGVTLTVSDGENPGVSIFFDLEVIDTEPPVALADVPGTVGSEDLLELTSISTDNTEIISHLWTLTLPDGTEITQDGKDFEYDLIAIRGNMTLVLRVEDGMGNFGEAEYEIEALDLQAPIVMVPSDVQVYEDSLVILRDQGSYDNIGIVSHEWELNGEVYEGVDFSMSFLTPGEYNVTLTCRDSSGNEGFDWVIVTVLAKGDQYDTDGDGMPDVWENEMGTNPLVDDRNKDPDGDLIINILEMEYGTDPLNSDTDGDLLPDNYELKYGFDPVVANDHSDEDFDGDGDSNLVEYLQGDRRDPTVADADEVEEDRSGFYLMVAIALALIILIVVVAIVMFATRVKPVEEEFPEKDFPHLYKKVETAPKMEAPAPSADPQAPPQ